MLRRERIWTLVIYRPDDNISAGWMSADSLSTLRQAMADVAPEMADNVPLFDPGPSCYEFTAGDRKCLLLHGPLWRYDSRIPYPIVHGHRCVVSIEEDHNG